MNRMVVISKVRVIITSRLVLVHKSQRGLKVITMIKAILHKNKWLLTPYSRQYLSHLYPISQ